MRRGQGAVEYIIILGVIILIALIVVGSLGGFGIFDFSTTATQRTTEISNLLSDVSLKYVIGDNGAVQVSIRSQTNERIIAHNMSINDTQRGVCWVNMTNRVVRQQFVAFSNSSCADELSGIAGDAYGFECTIRYTDAAGIYHSKTGSCAGAYEDL